MAKIMLLHLTRILQYPRVLDLVTTALGRADDAQPSAQVLGTIGTQPSQVSTIISYQGISSTRIAAKEERRGIFCSDIWYWTSRQLRALIP
jgi:hypothetical protein